MLQIARELADSFLDIVAQQILPDGRLPEELARPRPIHYTCYGLAAFMRTAMLAQWAGVDVLSRYVHS